MILTLRTGVMRRHSRRKAYICLVVSALLGSVTCASGPQSGDAGPGCTDHPSSPAILVGSDPKCKEIMAPILLHCVDPMYPTAVRNQKAEGKVVVDAILNTAGTLENMKVKTSTTATLPSLALAALAERRYKPAVCRESGEPVRVYLTLTVTFWLGGAKPK
jgi:TonB family protein